ncbi:cytochrome c [Parasulfuritortus cantonensis]|uniref:Cytochrome c n=1 Tax=Parasulfuritortus cantonensis TaxID=2528202 RepID=A0A4R1BA60_9PROT|nr:cytochrome c [Parasulfuritortus cantonensis]TCJ13836.1 cytochrome c [Parasulfuritortus cantonensis]
MNRIVPALLFLLWSVAGQAAPFANADAKAGKALHDKRCVACHASRFGGDGSKIYTRAERRVKSASALAQQITTCNANLGNDLFPEDEANIGAYLNKTWYKFK